MGGVKIVWAGEAPEEIEEECSDGGRERVVRHNGSQLQAGIQSNADFSKGYQTGRYQA